jgi:hypothetical protein
MNADIAREKGLSQEGQFCNNDWGETGPDRHP